VAHKRTRVNLRAFRIFVKSTATMLKVPYGESDFQKIMTKGYFYQDRTSFIEQLEKWNSNYPVFLRPRRFGKSLFISTLHYYYGIEFKEIFEQLFGHLYIGQHPTPLPIRIWFCGLSLAGLIRRHMKAPIRVF